jgi:hypothetical protein
MMYRFLMGVFVLLGVLSEIWTRRRGLHVQRNCKPPSCPMRSRNSVM